MSTDHDDLSKALFAQLVMMFSTSALQHLGKIANPATQKAEVNLDAAQATIDMLDMLQAKTEGNLDDEERRMLKDTVSALKLNYVETSRSAEAESPEPEAPPTETAEPPAAEPQAAAEGSSIETSSEREEKQPRFHKKYD